MARTPIGKLAASDHAMHAVGEMQALDAAFERLRDRIGANMPVWERLRASGNPQNIPTRAANETVLDFHRSTSRSA